MKERGCRSAGSMLHAKRPFDPPTAPVSGLKRFIRHAFVSRPEAHAVILTGRRFFLQTPLVRQQTQAELSVRSRSLTGSEKKREAASTHSRYLVQGAGSDMAMKKQLVRMVNMMNRLNNVDKGLRKLPPRHGSNYTFCVCQQCCSRTHDVSSNPLKCSH